MSSKQKVVVLGQGYVGLPLAMAAVESGYTVTGAEVSQTKVDALRRGNSYVEDVSDGTIADALHSGQYAPVYVSVENASSLANFDIAVITVPTPLFDGKPDLSYVEDAAVMLAKHLKPGAGQTVILESTTYPGTTEEIVIPILQRVSKLTAGKDFHVGFSPERIDPGNEDWTLFTTPKVVSGFTEACLAKVDAFYQGMAIRTVPVKAIKSAEMAKIIENTFRHVNIALVNELGRLSHGLGVDINEALDAAGTKPFGFMKFTPGPGVGGHCLPIDPLYLSHRVEQKLGVPSRFIDLAQDVNDHQPDYVVQRIMEGLNRRGKAVNGSKIVLFGLAYKPDVADVRETPATRVVQLLAELGAEVHVIDPHVYRARPSSVEWNLPADIYESYGPHSLERYDAAVILTNHSEFDYAEIVAESKYVLDTRNVSSAGTNVEHL